MSKKPTPDQKILLMTDSACDIPDAELTTGGIVMLPIPIVVDGKGYLERVDFTIPEFYEMLTAAKELPVTSHILSLTYAQAYQDAWAAGYTHIINTTITSKGSNMFEAAVLGKRQFFDQTPDARDHIQITILDSGTYSLGYGYPILEASRMIRNGKTAEEITAYLEDWYARVEIYFAAYSLEYARKSGRIPAATAFVGDVLGLRPIISILDGVTTVVEKVRGDKNVAPHVAEQAFARTADKKAPYAVAYGSVEQYGDELWKIAAKRFGHASKQKFYLGAAITINSGPKAIGIVVRGERREGTRAREQDYT